MIAYKKGKLHPLILSSPIISKQAIESYFIYFRQ